MLLLLFFALGFALGLMLGLLFSRSKKGFFERQKIEKSANKKRVLAIFYPGKRITNDEVERALGVSDATTTRYLEELEKEGKIRQVGRTGKSVYYEIMNGSTR